MRARAVIGANFGDEGKGLVTDYLCATQGAGMVVRFNGGAQAGHTVVDPDGRRHVFSHVGSGAIWGVPTFLSQFFICNPLLLAEELHKLETLDIRPEIFAHPNCLVSSFADMVINQRKEEARGAARHGSVGLGIHETIQRSAVPELKITMSDLWNGTDIRGRLRETCDRWARFRTGSVIDNPEEMIEVFVNKVCEPVAEYIRPLGIGQCVDPVFEGAQGLQLDMDNKSMIPHVTHSSTGSKNVKILCEQAGITEIDYYYVSRTYLTRHGAGLLPNEDKNMSYPDDTNKPHKFQGSLRFAPLDYVDLTKRTGIDCGGKHNIVLTHCDQQDPLAKLATLQFYGPTRADVEDVK